MVAKRALDFGTASRAAKRPKKTVVVRGKKSEMKKEAFGVTYAAATTADLELTSIANGPQSHARIGAKVKIWRIDGIIRTDIPCRVDLLVPYETDNAPAYGLDGVAAADTYMVLDTYLFNPNTTGYEQFHINHKLPYGMIVHYSGDTATTVRRNQIIARIQTRANTTIYGYLRVWFTDV